MPRISLYKPEKGQDYTFLDQTIAEMFTVGGTDVFVHKYLGPVNPDEEDATAAQPRYDAVKETNIQDLLFLENRDRKYDPNIYQIRGIYNVNDIDFDMSQFGLFLQNDTIFLTVHINSSVKTIGRKLMSGDVIELPHLKDQHALNDYQMALKRFYVIQDINRAAEGFSPTWYPHLYRLKLKQIVDSQEFKEILDLPAEEGSTNTLRDVLSTYEKEMQINNAVVAQAEADSNKSGYNTKNLYTLQVDEQGKPELVTTDINTLDASTANEMADRINQTPDRTGYNGYLLGDGFAPNGEVFGHGIGFPQGSVKGDYFLRTDFLPNRLFRYDGSRWIKMEDAVRMTLTNTNTRNTQKTGFINNTNTTTVAGQTIEQRQSLSQALKPKADN
jgi:D-ribose pyranose/furanose isomerase RbsD